jgi:hypothetical protein
LFSHKEVKGYNGSADRKLPGLQRRRPVVPLSDVLALERFNAMISDHHESNCPLLHFACFEFGDFDFIGTRSSIAICDIECFSFTGTAERSAL